MSRGDVVTATYTDVARTYNAAEWRHHMTTDNDRVIYHQRAFSHYVNIAVVVDTSGAGVL